MPDPHTEPSPAAPLLRLRGVCKAYAAPVLRDVDLDLLAGEVHALMGANGAGKSTLAKIVSGLVRGDEGLMALDGEPYRPSSKAQAEALGIQIVQQELTLIPTLSVAENLFLNRLPSAAGVVRYRRLRRQALRALDAVGLGGLEPETPTARLGVGEQQLVEIARALARPCRVLILDEPTAALSGPQVEQLFHHVARLKGEGVAIVYVSHRLEELRRIADRITVLRDGRVVATRPAASLGIDEAVRLMVGTNPEKELRPQARPRGDEVLRVEGLSRGDRVRDISLTLHRGEVLGVSGLVGSGRTELLRAIFGADRADSGELYLRGSTRPRRFASPRQAVRESVGMVPEDRKAEGLLLTLPVRLNLTLARMARLVGPGGWIRGRREDEAAGAAAARVRVHCHSIEQPVGTLSGGNQQKVLMGRWLLRDPDVLLLDEPTRGIDVAAKFAIYRLIDELAAAGKGILVVSSEVEELMLICDRIAVLSAGRLVRTYGRGEWSEEGLLAAAFEGYAGGAKRPKPEGLSHELQ
ncbi:Galactose/methyl galactoside import ATP-binding protein MglA [Aquisphaera giovannonii]|uniref:Galactose/methyl galactoside import ATP-binding protein MglA n=1 Tax=Aquisphaera giovannonii TaxID=406548 RepID=A0A5B9W0R1_9BACT|nr:sugar ABC transporter ATP-binding protein [Aquisphaera giovannonii]QEH33545.1 Galactose/methyl galactoside import ATP-binding protein MglA [Aquisphaera giovannonii]